LIRGRVLFLFISSGLLSGQQPASSPNMQAARQAEASGNFALAESIYERAVAAHPDADLYQRLGLVRHLQNKFSEASSAFENAVRLNRALWTSRLFLGIDYYRMNRFPDARTQLEAADRLQPDQQETRFWLGATYLALREYLPGLQMLETALEKNPRSTEVLKLLAESYADYGTQLLNEVAEKYPDSAAGLEVQGKAFEFEGSYEAALNAYREAAAKDPNRPGINEAIARVSNRH
jgi:tetratricopeptide (TPR) repeat protein